MYKQRSAYRPVEAQEEETVMHSTPNPYLPYNFVGVKMVMYSYSLANIIDPHMTTITRTEIGGLDDGLFGRLSDAYHKIADVVIPDDLPDWQLAIAQSWKDTPGTYSLHMEIYDGAHPPMDIELIGSAQFNELVPFL